MQKNIDLKFKLSENNLDRVCGWITHSDSKTSVIFVFLIGLTAFLSTRINDVKYFFLLHQKLEIRFIIVISVVGYLFFLIQALYFLFKSLNPRIKTNGNSLFFFRTIAQETKDEFKQKIKKLSVSKMLDQINEQTHVNSQIATQKFEDVRFGIRAIKYILLFWFVLLVISLI